MSNLITKPEAGALTVPDYLSGVSSKDGMEDLSNDVFTVPRLTLLQSSSKDVKKKLAHAGVFQNALTKEEYGDHIELVFLKVSQGAVYMTMEDGLKCKSIDGKVNQMNGGKCDECWLNANHKVWVDGKAPLCSTTFDFIAVTRASLLTDMPNMLAVSFMKTSHKMAKDKIISRARALNKPLYAQSYLFGSEFIDNPKGGFNNYTISFPGWLKQDEFIAAEKLAAMCKTREYKIQDEEVPQAEATASATVDDV